MADNIRIEPDGTFGGIGTLDESTVSQVKRVPGVSDAFGVLVTVLDPKEGMEDLVQTWFLVFS